MEEDVNKCEVLVTASEVLNEDYLTLWMENAIEQNGSESDVVKVKLSSDRLHAIVTFSKDVNVDDIKRYADRLSLKEKLNVEYFKRNKIIVHNLPEQIDEDTVLLYFESSRSCPSGGNVAHVDLYDDQHCAVVEFEESSVVDKVLSKLHTISGLRIQVEPWDPLVDLGNNKASTNVVEEKLLNTKKMSKATWSGAVSKTVEKSNDAPVIIKTKADGRVDNNADGTGGNKADGAGDNKADGTGGNKAGGAGGNKGDDTGGNKAYGTGGSKADGAGGNEAHGTGGHKVGGTGGNKAVLSNLGTSEHSSVSAAQGSLSQKVVKSGSQSQAGNQQPRNSRSESVSQRQLGTTTTATSAVRRMEIPDHIQIKCESMEHLVDIKRKLYDKGMLKLFEKCSAQIDDRNLTVTLTGRNEASVHQLGEIMYDDHWTAEVNITSDLGRQLFKHDRRWANYVINKNLQKGSGLFKLNHKQCPVVAAFSQDVAVAGAENLKRHILCGRIQQDCLRSTDWKKCKEDFERGKPIVITVNEKYVTVTGVPHHVIRCVGEINEKFSKFKSR